MFHSDLFGAAPVVGFSGSRVLSPAMEMAIDYVGSFVPSAALVYTGDCRGVDKYVRSKCDRVQVFKTRNYANTAHRSISFVQALRAAGGVLVAFPGGACPGGVLPCSVSSRCFCGAGSGTWASAAYAVGLGVPVVLWLGAASLPPGWVPSYVVGSYAVFLSSSEQPRLF